MSMTLNPVNEAAFQKAVQSLETLNRAAVFHPTGTGKSCIAWKVVEAHPQTTFFWLVAGAQRLALRQAELTRYNGGTLPGNVRFCDCEKPPPPRSSGCGWGSRNPAASCWTATMS